ncbi:type II toxin-antitoxin system PemK/MazF family toxin [Helicobacter felis]|uniref:type II toxin-antitoxin system PemK/MazF family toxin n=1 Tax=Helicobacter felis TaxID=214 RepID=UPI000CF06A9A|nr:type II toxin-antitoxin system PemK/MazF family toxin [Helicobacter felis]
MPIDLVWYQDKYAEGHEQKEKRPHLIIYEGKDFFLAFPQTTQNKQAKEYPSHKNYIINDHGKLIEVMIDQLRIVPKIQILENNTMETGLSAGLRRVSIAKSVSAHRKPLVEYFLKKAILQSESHKNKHAKQITFGDVIKLKLHNKNPLLHPCNTFIVLSCANFHCSSMCLVAPYKDKSIIFELLHCIDFQKREFELLDNAKDCLDIENLCEKIRLSLEI